MSTAHKRALDAVALGEPTAIQLPLGMVFHPAKGPPSLTAAGVTYRKALHRLLPVEHADLRWYILEEVADSHGTKEVTAATICDGIALLASWARCDDGTWEVRTCDLNSAGERVETFEEGQPVPATPPVRSPT